jgi:hypothetical protein
LRPQQNVPGFSLLSETRTEKRKEKRREFLCNKSEKARGRHVIGRGLEDNREDLDQCYEETPFATIFFGTYDMIGFKKKLRILFTLYNITV